MEEISNFQYIWKRWIVPLVNDLYGQSDEKFRKECDLKIRNLDEICLVAEKYYQNKRMELKKIFYGEYHSGDSKKEHRMDFHKIGAILCRTLIEYKIYDFDKERCKVYVDDNIKSYETDWVVKNALINYRLAFYGSIVFLFHSMLFIYAETDKDLYDALLEKSKLDLYEGNLLADIDKTQVKESFENCIVLDLAKRDVGNHSFDYFMYAIILYQLEEYNKSLLDKQKIQA